jgi:hypothetical protein
VPGDEAHEGVAGGREREHVGDHGPDAVLIEAIEIEPLRGGRREELAQGLPDLIAARRPKHEQPGARERC